MKLFSARNFSLFCTVFNAAVAISLFNNGDTALGLLCTAFACLCARNFLVAR